MRTIISHSGKARFRNIAIVSTVGFFLGIFVGLKGLDSSRTLPVGFYFACGAGFIAHSLAYYFSTGWRVFIRKQMTFSGSRTKYPLMDPEDLLYIYGPDLLHSQCIEALRNNERVIHSKMQFSMVEGPVHVVEILGIYHAFFPSIVTDFTPQQIRAECSCVAIYQQTKWVPTGLILLGRYPEAAQELRKQIAEHHPAN